MIKLLSIDYIDTFKDKISNRKLLKERAIFVNLNKDEFKYIMNFILLN